MKLWENQRYLQDIEYITSLPYLWEKIQNKRLLVTGAGGLIGSVLVDAVMYRNRQFQDNCCVTALDINEQVGNIRFGYCRDDERFNFVCHDIKKPLPDIGHFDYVVHLASNSHPVAFASDPIGTITTIILGTHHLLDYVSNCCSSRILYGSSVEIYGENRGDTEDFDESYCGYIDCNTVRAGYNEAKRTAEALCQAYIKQWGMDILTARIPRTFGPSMILSDSSAISQFIKKGIAKEDIVLKSSGMQKFSYSYVADVAAGIFKILFSGKCGEAYNIAGADSDKPLKDLAEAVAEFAGTNVVFETADTTEAAGWSKSTRAVLNSSKLQRLGWEPKYNSIKALEKTISILLEVE